MIFTQVLHTRVSRRTFENPVLVVLYSARKILSRYICWYRTPGIEVSRYLTKWSQNPEDTHHKIKNKNRHRIIVYQRTFSFLILRLLYNNNNNHHHNHNHTSRRQYDTKQKRKYTHTHILNHILSYIIMALCLINHFFWENEVRLKVRCYMMQCLMIWHGSCNIRSNIYIDICIYIHIFSYTHAYAHIRRF